MNVRMADRPSIPQVLGLLRRMHDEAPHLRDVPLDEQRAATALAAMVDGDSLLIAQAPTGEIVGFMAFCLYPEWWSGRLLAGELALFVAPEWRGLMVANRLIAAAAASAGSRGASEFGAGAYTGVKPEAAWAVYRRAGFQKVGLQFRCRLGIEGVEGNSLASI